MAYIIIDTAYDNYDNSILEKKANYIKFNQDRIKNEVHRIVNYINYFIKHDDNINKNNKDKSDLLKEIYSYIDKDRYGYKDKGYFFIYNTDNIMQLHPIQKELEQTNMTDYKSLDGQYLFHSFNKLLENSLDGYLTYKWYTTDNIKTDEKTTYIYLIKELDIVIASGFYASDIHDYSKLGENELEESLKKALSKGFLFLSILVVLSLLTAYYISRRIEKIEIEKQKEVNTLEQYKIILDATSVVSKTDINGIITYVSDSFCKTSGFSREELIGNSHKLINHPETAKSYFKKMWTRINRGKTWKGILKNRRKNGDSFYNKMVIVPIKDSEGKILEFISSGEDITELIENRTKLETIFSTDTLTGLGNRISLINEIEKDSFGTLCLLNINNFKSINDAEGHESGDTILKILASRIFNKIDINNYKYFRLQGDVFAIYSDSHKEKEIYDSVEKFLKEEASKPYTIKGTSFSLTYSVGIASTNNNLLTFANAALLEAKRKKVKMQKFLPEMNNLEEVKLSLKWVEKLQIAIKEDRIVPYFQPIYDYKTKTITKYECLMRLIEEGNVVFPGEYLPIAKKTNLYPELTQSIVLKSIDKFSGLKDEFSVNLCTEDLMNQSLMNKIYEYGKKKNVLNQMIIEIVESEEMEDSDAVSRNLSKLKKAGVRIAIDDFGTGYSNYDYLISLKPDFVKIDGSIINHLKDDARTHEVVKSLVSFSKTYNIKIIAEFVSSKELDELVYSLDIDYAQGFFYGKAEPTILN